MMDKNTYSPETAGGLMVTSVPVVKTNTTASEVMTILASKDWGDVHTIFVLSEEKTLVGLIPVPKVLAAKKDETAEQLMSKPKLTITPSLSQVNLVREAIKSDVESVPVVDDNGKLLGVVLADEIIDILHKEHLEYFFRSSGIRGKGANLLELATGNLFFILKARLPWLIVGLIVGIGLGVIARGFERTLQENIALAFFIPVIAYIADSVGTQTETIFIRAISVLKVNILAYLLKELFIGILIGAFLGLLGAIGAILISQTFIIGLVVGISLFLAVVIATVLACLIPIAFNVLRQDPALGSGPLATALQDIISITIYFLVATLIL
ncbi:Magnesium transporter mgtE [Legionella lansingensis]|uniref:Magnesium transporter MgtE n=1 Tax=Legionella lansingensis TaxID=45067 RepID=A0A0W0VZX9_9GAMM|nr:magnesium transporter [Legionella lansingensis]KTD25691.1 Magnesium transporter MgtE [Legionella lansingensis]SNV49166.1 Magnesium transporter mgtE [Legionella lansingensis]